MTWTCSETNLRSHHQADQPLDNHHPQPGEVDKVGAAVEGEDSAEEAAEGQDQDLRAPRH